VFDRQGALHGLYSVRTKPASHLILDGGNGPFALYACVLTAIRVLSVPPLAMPCDVKLSPSLRQVLRTGNVRILIKLSSPTVSGAGGRVSLNSQSNGVQVYEQDTYGFLVSKFSAQRRRGTLLALDHGAVAAYSSVTLSTSVTEV
jgi:hypothetical protein